MLKELKQLLLEAKATSKIDIEYQEVEAPFIEELRQYMLNELREIEATDRASASQIKNHYLILRDTQQFNALMAAIHRELLNTFFVKSKRAQRKFMHEVIDEVIVGGKAKKHESIYEEQIINHLRNTIHQELWKLKKFLREYTERLNLIAIDGNLVHITPLGNLFLSSPELKCIKFLLIIENFLSGGQWDRLCMPRETLRWVWNQKKIKWCSDDLIPPLEDAIKRLEMLGLVSMKYEAGHTIFALQPKGEIILSDILDSVDESMISAIKVLLRETMSLDLGEMIESKEVFRKESGRIVAHEVRNSLIPLQGFIRKLFEKIEDKTLQEKELALYRTNINEAVSNLHAFINEYLQYSKIGSGITEEINISEAIEEVTKGFVPEVIKDIANGLPLMIGDKANFKKALLNLLYNAREAVKGRENPMVLIKASIGNGGRIVRVVVSDNGTGIKEEIRNKIFEPDFTTKEGGTGMGLAFVRKVIEEDFNGEVIFEPNITGGSDFIITIPVAG